MANSIRTLSGSCLAFADGILVCPTSSGAIVAVDTQRRWLLWSYTYPHTSNWNAQNQRLSYGQQTPNKLGKQWADGTPIIADGKVITSPVDSAHLHCLNLLTGELEWKMLRERLVVRRGRLARRGRRGRSEPRAGLGLGKPRAAVGI